MFMTMLEYLHQPWKVKNLMLEIQNFQLRNKSNNYKEKEFPNNQNYMKCNWNLEGNSWWINLKATLVVFKKKLMKKILEGEKELEA